MNSSAYYTSDDEDNYEDCNDEKIELSTSSYLKAIRPFSSTIDVVGVINEIFASKRVFLKSLNKETTVFKFVIGNNENDKIQVITWEEDINRIIDLIIIGSVIYIDGAFSKIIDLNDKNNYGTVPVELVIQTNTKIKIFGKAILNPRVIEEIENYPTVQIDECLQYLKKRIRLQGYIKTNFDVIKNQRDNTLSCVGSLASESQRKVEAKIIKFELPFINPFNKGEHVEIIDNAIFHIESIKDIKKIDEKIMMTLPQLIKSNKEVSFPINSRYPNKKFKHKKNALFSTSNSIDSVGIDQLM
ncbi:hypothetical protein KQX54_014669 [Cotesia glomerata]|uniref:OB domain-containing protein n=1 Tax=Cotesia glomerata TaxID=32391 RepID=A0AAV7I983_COTGL|nr:hypothetical protein KQX54_014669 [Cotesia glomerata]